MIFYLRSAAIHDSGTYMGSVHPGMAHFALLRPARTPVHCRI
jgi:hypothetical protein